MFTFVNSKVTGGQRCSVTGFLPSPPKGDVSSSSQRCFLSILYMYFVFLHKKALKYNHTGISKGVGLDSRQRCPCSDSAHGQCQWLH